MGGDEGGVCMGPAMFAIPRGEGVPQCCWPCWGGCCCWCWWSPFTLSGGVSEPESIPLVPSLKKERDVFFKPWKKIAKTLLLLMIWLNWGEVHLFKCRQKHHWSYFSFKKLMIKYVCVLGMWKWMIVVLLTSTTVIIIFCFWIWPIWKKGKINK